jgi:hypothetical protein
VGTMNVVESSLVVQYETSEEQIAKLAEECKGISFDTPEHYETGRVALGNLRTLRVAVEKKRKELKSDVLERGRNIDAVAKHFSGLIEAIENPLLAAKKAVDDEEERLKQEKERADLIALNARLTAEREAEEARLAVERDRLAAERAQQEEANRIAAEAQRLEREKLDAQRAELRKQQEAIDAANRLTAQHEAERKRREQAERDRIAAEEAAKAEAVRIEALRPEVEKINAFAIQVRAVADQAPSVESIECRRALDWALGKLKLTADGLAAFKGKVGP